MSSIDVKDIKNKLIERLRPSGWASVLSTFILSSDFDKILDKLLQLHKDGKRFTPPLKTLFRALEECSYNNVKVVMLGQDPYPQVSPEGINVADGMAFSCGNTNVLQPSLLYMSEEIGRTVYPEFVGYKAATDLLPWAQQGILLLNAALTTEVNKVGIHYDIWRPFITFLLDYLSWNKEGLVFAFLGKVAQEFEPIVGNQHAKLFAVHPAAAYHKRDKQWDSGDLFNKVNGILTKTNKKPIIW